MWKLEEGPFCFDVQPSDFTEPDIDLHLRGRSGPNDRVWHPEGTSHIAYQQRAPCFRAAHHETAPDRSRSTTGFHKMYASRNYFGIFMVKMAAMLKLHV